MPTQAISPYQDGSQRLFSTNQLFFRTSEIEGDRLVSPSLAPRKTSSL
jgi:hypothetical protein